MSAEAMWTLIFSAVVAVSTVVYAVLTWRLVQETEKMRSAQTDPSIGLHVEPSATGHQLFMMVVANYGLGPALDIRFSVEANGATADLPLAFLKQISGITYLAPGQKVVAFYGTALELLRRDDKGLARVHASYRKPNGKTVTDTFTLDPSRFEGMPQVGNDYLRDLAQSVEDIGKHLARIVHNSRLQITTQSWDEQQSKYSALIEKAAAKRNPQTAPAKPEAGSASAPNCGDKPANPPR